MRQRPTRRSLFEARGSEPGRRQRARQRLHAGEDDGAQPFAAALAGPEERLHSHHPGGPTAADAELPALAHAGDVVEFDCIAWPHSCRSADSPVTTSASNAAGRSPCVPRMRLTPRIAARGHARRDEDEHGNEEDGYSMTHRATRVHRDSASPQSRPKHGGLRTPTLPSTSGTGGAAGDRQALPTPARLEQPAVSEPAPGSGRATRLQADVDAELVAAAPPVRRLSR